MSSKDWTMNCILAGAEIARLLKAKKVQAAKLHLENLTSELSPQDREYLITRVYDVLAKKDY